MPSYSGFFVLIRPKAKESVCTAAVFLSYILRMYILTNDAFFLKYMSIKIGWEGVAGFIWLRIWASVCSYEHGCQPVNFQNQVELLEELSWYED